jgi:hypothetical protein
MRIYSKNRLNHLVKSFLKWREINNIYSKLGKIKAEVEEAFDKKLENDLINLETKIKDKERENLDLKKSMNKCIELENELVKKIKYFEEKENNFLSVIKKIEEEKNNINEELMNKERNFEEESGENGNMHLEDKVWYNNNIFIIYNFY